MGDGPPPWHGHRIRRRSISRCTAPFDARRTASRHRSVGVAPQASSHAGYLDVSRYAAVQCHPRTGAQWLEPYRFLRNASVIIAHHHERWDGSGYPYGIRGTFIPIEARVLAIADAFDAIQVPAVTDQDSTRQSGLPHPHRRIRDTIRSSSCRDVCGTACNDRTLFSHSN